MNIRQISAGWRTFCIDAVTPEPWRNGGGLTRTIATSADHDGIVWRVSVADINQDGADDRTKQRAAPAECDPDHQLGTEHEAGVFRCHHHLHARNQYSGDQGFN